MSPSWLYPTSANGIIVLVNSQTGFCRRFLFHNYRGLKLKTSCEKFLNLAHYFAYHANQKASNAIVRAENLLINVSLYFEEAVTPYRKNVVKKKTLSHRHIGFQAEKIVHLILICISTDRVHALKRFTLAAWLYY